MDMFVAFLSRKDIVVTWPDRHETHGIDKHIEDLKAMFVHAPDIRIAVDL